MKSLLVGLAGLAVAIWITPVSAHDLIIQNLTSFSIDHVAATPGDIVNFRRVPPGTLKTFEIEMPQGKCDARFRLTFDDGQTIEMGGHVCGGIRLRIGETH